MMRKAISGFFSHLSSSSAVPDLDKYMEELEKVFLSKIRSMVNDFESKVKLKAADEQKLNELRKMVFDTEELIDEYRTEQLRAKLEQTESLKRKHGDQEVRRPSSNSSPSVIIPDGSMIDEKRQDILSRFADYKKGWKALDPKKGDGKIRIDLDSTRTPTGSHPNENRIFGRETDMEKIISILLRKSQAQFLPVPKGEEVKYNNVIVLTIIGTGGIGKTALAQHVYNDTGVEAYFNRRAWAWVSEPFNVLRLTKAVYESFTGGTFRSDGQRYVQDKLRQELEGKRFLLVLDNVWNQDPEDWKSFLSPLDSGEEGSVVMITIRSLDVTNAIPGIRKLRPHVMESLPPKDCWSLLLSQAFDGQDLKEHPELVSIGDKIIEKCKRLPLAVKVVAGILRHTYDVDKWNGALQADISDSVGSKGGVLRDLKASYRCLPLELKRCFAYCSLLFPNDHKFNIESLVKLWMAEGFIEPEDGKQLEDIGSEYFKKLWHRSFFQYLGSGSFDMHNFADDFLPSFPRDYYSRNEDDTLGELSENVRHLSSVVQGDEPKIQFLPLAKASALHTFLTVPIEATAHIKLSAEVLETLRNLRVLDLSYTDLEELPESIGHLKHLHFLGLNHTNIKMLPESICKLYNLQTLELKSCERLRELPKGTRNLINLRHLDLDVDLTYFCLPTGIRCLTELRTLPIFNVGRTGGYAGIKELENLDNLSGKLYVSGLCNIFDISHSRRALVNKKHLEELTLVWPFHMADSENEQFSDDDDFNFSSEDTKGTDSNYGQVSSTELENFTHEDTSCVVPKEKHVQVKDVLESLEPHTLLKKLTLQSYVGTRFPKWLEDHRFPNMTYVKLENCKKIDNLLPLGLLPSLNFLSVKCLPMLRCVGVEHEFCFPHMTQFPSLKILTFTDMDKLKELRKVVEDHFPKLEKLTFLNCPHLMDIPQLDTLMTLEMDNCGRLEILPLLTSLKTLSLVACDGLTVVPSIESLCSLTVMYCKRLESLPEVVALKDLWIEDCELLKYPSTRWLLDKLNCLSNLLVANCPKLQISPDKKMPTSYDVQILKRWLQTNGYASD